MPKQLGDITVYHLPEIKAEFDISIKSLRQYCKEGRLPARKCGSKWFVEETALQEFFRTGNAQIDGGNGQAA